jgi:general secretion pathway protein D
MTSRFVCLSLAAVLLIASSRLNAQTPPATPAPGAGAPAGAVAASVKPADDEMIAGPIRFSDMPIDGVLDQLATLTGRAILRPNSLPTANYTLRIERPIPKSELILALETLLKHNQVGVSPQGDRFLNVVPLGLVKNEAPEMINGSAFEQPASGKIATKIFQLDFLRATEFAALIQQMLTPTLQGGMVVLDKANAAMITDTVSNLQRIETLLKTLDRPATSGLTPKFYTLRNGAKASDLVNKMRTIIGSGPLQVQLGTTTTYNADDRTNQVILIADPRQYPFFDDLIAKLDIKADPNTRSEVIALKHAVAKDVQSLLQNLVTSQTSASQRAQGGQSVRAGQFGGLPNQAGAPPAAPVPGAPIGPVTAAAGTSAVSLGGNGETGGSNEFSSLAMAVADERTNSIIVFGTSDDIRLIRELVDKIDIILAQVSIQVIIAEVTLNDSDKTGLSALGFTVGTDAPSSSATGPVGSTGHGTHITNFDPIGVAGWAFTGGVVNPLAFKAALGDTGSRSNVKILSSPTIMTTHAKEGQVVVGEQRPVVTATNTSIGGAGGTSSSYTYKTIAIDLKVTPFIGDDGGIQLKIDQKVDDVLGTTTIDGNQVPTIGTREAMGSINVYDGEMVVLGGLQRRKISADRAKIGFLAEIPILSQILGGRNKSVERTELLLFVRPHIIRPGDGSRDAQKTIDGLTNKDQINQFLIDPSKPVKEPFIENFK